MPNKFKYMAHIGQNKETIQYKLQYNCRYRLRFKTPIYGITKYHT